MLATTTTTTTTTTTATTATTKTATAAIATTTKTTITSDPGILCFHHCNVKVFCFTLPHLCPHCHAALDTTASGGGGGGGGVGCGIATKLLPFRLPYPFVRASQYPCAIVLRPTTGDFLNDYNNATDLHIAVTTSTGCIVEFDRNGLQRQRGDNMPEWWQCLLVGEVPEPWFDYWDEVLMQICKQQPARWTVSHYHEDTHNCYTFVLAFLQALAYDKLSVPARSKTSFCEKFIVPRTTTAGKYISLYRKLRDAGIYVHPHRQQQHAKTKLKTTSATASTTVAGAAAAAATTKTAIQSVKTTAMQTTVSNIMSRTPTLCTIEE